YDHASFLMTKYTRGSNWGLIEAQGLAFVAITFPEFRDSKQWNKEAIMRLNTEIQKQVYPDGFQRELSIDYHIGCIGWFIRTYDLAKMNGQVNVFPESYLKIIKRCVKPL